MGHIDVRKPGAGSGHVRLALSWLSVIRLRYRAMGDLMAPNRSPPLLPLSSCEVSLLARRSRTKALPVALGLGLEDTWLDQRLSAMIYAYMYAGSRCIVEIMRTTLNIDDELLRKARLLSGVQEKTALVREGLKALIERESARRLALLGGTEPELEPIPRRRPQTGS